MATEFYIYYGQIWEVVAGLRNINYGVRVIDYGAKSIGGDIATLSFQV